jgi:hypothetical protein
MTQTLLNTKSQTSILKTMRPSRLCHLLLSFLDKGFSGFGGAAFSVLGMFFI